MTVADLITKLKEMPQGANVITERDLDFLSVKVEQVTDNVVAINPAPYCDLIVGHRCPQP